MHPPHLPRRPLTLEERVAALEADKFERDTNARQTADRQSHEITQAIEAAVAHVAEPRFGRVDRVNNEQIGYLKTLQEAADRSEAERVRRITAEVTLASIKEREELDRAAKASARSHRIKVLAIFVPIVVAILGLVGAAIGSQIQNAHPAPEHPQHP